MKLQTRLALAFLALSLLSMALIAIVSFRMGRQQILNDAFKQLRVTNQLTGQEFDRWLENSQRTLQAVAQRPLVVSLSQDIASGLDTDQAELVDQLLAVHFQPRLQEVEFESLFLLHPETGEILASTDPDQIGKYREQQDYYRQGRSSTTVQNIYYSMTEQRPRLTVGTPITDETGQLVGVLAGHLNLAEMSRIFSSSSEATESKESYLVNGRGLAISELLYREDAILQTWVRTEGVDQCLAGRSLQGVFQDYRGVQVLGVYGWHDDYSVCLVTEIDETEALAPILEFRSSIIGFGFLLALAVAGIGYGFTSRLAAPVVKMREVARRYRQGELDLRMPIPATFEFRELAIEFNRMAAELQKDLEDLEQRYESLFESVPVGLYQSSRRGQLLEVNQALINILGYDSRQELLSTPAPILYENPQDREEWVSQLDQFESVQNFEVRVRRKDGEMIWLHHDAHLTTTPEGEEVIEGAVFDITQRHQIAKELRASEARFRSVVQNSQDVISILDAEGNYQYVSPAMEAVLGRSPEDLTGENAFELVHPDDVAETKEKFMGLLQNPAEKIQARFRFLDGDNDWRYLEALGANYLDDPDLAGVVINSRDITIRVLAEQRLQEYAAELERSNEELEQFAYVASHDLQEPLRMVASYVKLLERRYGDQLAGEAKEFIEYAVDGAQRMQQLISDLLKFSRVGTRGRDLEEVDSGQIVESVIHTLGPQIEESGGRVEIEGELPEVMADPGQLQQVFQNLISNGLKFCADQPPIVRVSANKNGTAWRFTVEDNGIGIDPKFSDRLFVIFQRLHTRQEYEGTGIGLALSKKIVERHGGQIWFESEVGQGAKFHFTLSDIDNKGG